MQPTTCGDYRLPPISRIDRITAAIILAVSFAVFRLSAVHHLSDTGYEMFFTQQLLVNHRFHCDAGALPAMKSHQPGQVHQRNLDLPYQLVQRKERFYYFYPPANTILGVPFVAVANLAGISAIDQNGVYYVPAEVRIQESLAALLMAGLCVVIFFTSRLFLSFHWSLLVTAAAGLGTQIWSTASRLVWSHTWGILILGLVIWLILRAETQRKQIPSVLVASCLAWLYFVRPTFAISIAAVTIYVLIYHRASLLWFLATGAAWLAALVAFSQHQYGLLLPPYYHSYAHADPQSPTSFWYRLAGTLISPSRGLFVYVPVLLFIAYLLGRYHRTARTRLVVLALSIVVVHIIAISSFVGWHGGFCYGPRLITDVVPWFALLGMLALEARLRWRAENPARDSGLRLRSEWIFGLFLLLCSVTLNGIGATWGPASRWFLEPTNAQHDMKRFWDWRHPPFLGIPPASAIEDQNTEHPNARIQSPGPPK